MAVEDTLAWLGYPLVFLAALHALLGSILLRRPLRQQVMIVPAAITCWAFAAACLAAGLAYVYKSNGLDPDLPIRLTWCSWLPVVSATQIILSIRNPNGRAVRWAGWIGYSLGAIIVLIAVTTNLIQAGVPQLLPYVGNPGPLAGPIELVIAIVASVLVVLAVTSRKRIPDEIRSQASRVTLGLAATGVVAVGFEVVKFAGWTVDTTLAVYGSVFWAVGVIAALGPRGLFNLDVAAVHVSLVLTWGLVLAAIQWGLWTLLSPPLPGGVALVATCMVVVLGAYAGLPLSRRTLDRIDALLLSGRNRRPVLQQCMRAAVTYLDLDQLLDYLSRTLVREVGISSVSFLLEDEQGTLVPQRVQGDQADAGLPSGSPLANHLRLERRAFRIADVRSLPEGAQRDAIQEEMLLLGATLVLPLACKGRLLGILVLGPMASGARYTRDDVEMLSSLADQAAIAVENARLFRSATTDGLTGLLQRAYFLTRLKEEMERTRRYGRAASLLMLDIDHFKRVNDQFGHAEGDLVLKEVAALLRQGLRSSDIACRYGGEEFVVLLPETSGELASRVAERLREAAAATVLGQAGTVTLSIGVAEMHPEQQADSLIQQADVAMYQAKRSGRNRVVLWRSRSREPAAAEADAPEPSTGID